ncbi:Hydrophobin 2 [Beauveria brongniartii RCEF 3172]|uniref:Hydrophobin 2 n=1 Tax=Beauveria brongniartii RCEF 3172 TaxID=1081107 RepID=A0A167L8C0_9HYPO|nr:Hydrophobin 2 [Beauveria brongniartii RCEF 3172]
MKFIVFVSLIANALAVPAELAPRSYVACPPGLYSILQCCATDALGIVILDCKNPSRVPRDAKDFQVICAAIGQQAKCCVFPVLGQGLLCTGAAGVQ